MERIKKDKKPKRKPLELSNLNTAIFVIETILLVLLLLNHVFLYLNDEYAFFFVKNIVNPIDGFMFHICSYIDYLSYITRILYFIFVFLFFASTFYIEYVSKKEYDYRNKLVNKLYTVFIITIFIFTIPVIFSSYENHLPHLDTYFFKETKDKTYTKEDLINLEQYLADKIDYYSSTIKRDKDGNIKTNINYNKQAINNLHNIDDKIVLLKGLYPARSSKLDDKTRGFVGSKTIGFTTPYNTYFDYSGEPLSIIDTVTHEFCHTKGFVRESETVYCSFLAGVSSDDMLSNYSAYIQALSWTTESLMDIDSKKANDIEDKVLSKCLLNNYNELCDSYIKNTDSYINGAEQLIISSYYLKDYKDFKDELETSLNLLVKHGAKIIYKKKEVNVDKVLKLVDKEVDNRIIILLELDKKKFDKIKPAIENRKLYVSIHQKNDEKEESEDKKKDPVKYYLGPLKDKDEKIIFNATYGSVEYEYSRVARLLLEHFEKYGY